MQLSTPILVSSGAEPVTVAQAAEWLRLDDQPDVLAALITAAREWFEAATDRALTASTYQLKLDGFCDEIELPNPPLVAVVSVTYLDEDEVTQTLSTDVYHVVTSRVPARIELVDGESWPVTAVHPEAVTITYTAGGVNELVKTGIRILLTHWHENRGDGQGGGAKDDVPPSVKAIAWAAASYRF